MGNTVSKRQKRKTFQKGGFYPSVYGGVTGASMLAPLIARQTLRMYDSSLKRQTRKKRTFKKKKRNSTRSIA